jgi:hypothetical protein
MMKAIATIVMISGCVFTVSLLSSAQNGNETMNNPVNNPVKNLRGHTPQDIVIDGNVRLQDLLKDDSHGNHLRRRLGPTPTSKAIMVPCQNTTSDCGIHGVCRISGQNKFCRCDSGFYSLDKNNPCSEKGKSQTLYAVLWYMFGWTGGPAFALGWTLLGVLTLLTFCCGICCFSQNENDNISDSKKIGMGCFGLLSAIASFGLYIYVAVMISTDKCVDSNGVPCDMW